MRSSVAGITRQRAPIRVYLALLLAAQTVTIGGLVAYTSLRDMSRVRGEAQRSVAQKARQGAREIAETIQQAQNQLVISAALPGYDTIFQYPQGCTLTFDGAGPFSTGHSDVVRPDGSLACSSLAPTGGVPGRGYADAEWFGRLASTRAPVVEGPIRDAVTGEIVVMVAVPIPDVGGAITAAADLDKLERGLALRLAGPQDLDFKVTADGKTLVAGEPLSRAPRISGEATVPGLGWTLRVAQSDGDAVRSVVADIRTRSALAVASVLVILVVAMISNRRIAEPIRDLSEAVERASSGGAAFDPSAAGPREVIALRERFVEFARVRDQAQADTHAAFERQREAAERLAALNDLKDEFVDSVSHELRTPLTAIVGFAATLSRHSDSLTDEQRRDLVDRLVQSAHKLDGRVAELLDFNRLSSASFEVDRRMTQLRPLVERVLEDLDTTGRTVATDFADVSAACDGPRIARAIGTLVENALRHTPDGTPLEVVLRGVADGVLIAVNDRGPGIADEVKEAVFDPFRHGEPIGASPGVGIGLALVSRIAELHGGRSWVEDNPGGGASFRLLLAVDARAKLPTA